MEKTWWSDSEIVLHWESRSSLLNVIDPERYSSLSKLLAVTSHVIRFKMKMSLVRETTKLAP